MNTNSTLITDALPGSQPAVKVAPALPKGFQEVWYLKFNDPDSQRALWLRFILFQSVNGFRKLAEVWAVHFQRMPTGEVVKNVLKQSGELSSFSREEEGETGEILRFGGCELTRSGTRGEIRSKGNALKWDLRFSPAHHARFNLVPDALSRMRLVRSRAETVQEDLRVNGVTVLNNEVHEWKMSPGMEGHHRGPKYGDSWVWSHCNAFVNDQGRPVDFVFEGMSSRIRLPGNIPLPRVSSFYFLYDGVPYAFNTLWDSLRCRSIHTLNEWKFEAERGDLNFRGRVHAEHRDFAGLTYEDTDGSLLYCANAELTELSLLVYRKGKLEASLTSAGHAAFEVVSRTRNPYVPMMG